MTHSPLCITTLAMMSAIPSSLIHKQRQNSPVAVTREKGEVEEKGKLLKPRPGHAR